MGSFLPSRAPESSLPGAGFSFPASDTGARGVALGPEDARLVRRGVPASSLGVLLGRGAGAEPAEALGFAAFVAFGAGAAALAFPLPLALGGGDSSSAGSGRGEGC